MGIRAMGPAISARHKYHGRRTHAGHEKAVVIGAADHPAGRKSAGFRCELIRHKHRASMAALAGDGDSKGSRGGNFFHRTGINPIALQQGSLLDVELDESCIRTSVQADLAQRTLKPGLRPQNFQRIFVRILKRRCSGRLQRPTKQAASQPAGINPGGFFCGEKDDVQ
jgi:hypothetical protein